MKRIAVYCGASTGNHPIYTQAAIQLADWFIENHYELIYGGGGVGLMGVISNRILAKGGQVHGVMPKQLVDRGAESAQLAALSALTVVADMSERKAKMMQLSTGCIAMPGGVGTLEEIIQSFSWARLGDNPNPCAFYNVNNYYQPLITMFDQMVTAGFLSAEDRQKIIFSDSLSTIQQFMATYVPPRVRTYPESQPNKSASR
ncbi:cytokinin riboside 5'-monophosphate phosphoribohydrolase [Lentilactobacillus fungorum]|uniref:Cytokinin riboside 5'-monophosphate phosphoribohydrolase n=1 Tax=Lentilactobacillus fungorum TaxID=2201250 RepID=A0ABQ3VZ93_9LACO|nr:TIGR00730 family Rossman fold protein [Lentilactobacillus fungorum]GHP14225.1 cytokinin riboside 5'-monophosphate phosphoribohydrolase [Lentilactobacillus fungorum]